MRPSLEFRFRLVFAGLARMLSLTTIGVKVHPCVLAITAGDPMRTAVKAAVDEWGPKEGLEIGQLENHLGYFLRRLQIWVFQDFIQTLRPMKVRPAQYSVLLVIEANPGRSQAVIAQTLSIERARLARLLHVLERQTWIDKRRPLALTLSDQGRRKGAGADQESRQTARGAARRLRRTEAAAATSRSAARLRLTAVIPPRRRRAARRAAPFVPWRSPG